MAESTPRDMIPLFLTVSINNEKFNDFSPIISCLPNRCVAKKADVTRVAPTIVT